MLSHSNLTETAVKSPERASGVVDHSSVLTIIADRTAGGTGHQTGSPRGQTRGNCNRSAEPRAQSCLIRTRTQGLWGQMRTSTKSKSSLKTCDFIIKALKLY